MGAEELVEQIISGELAPDKLITTPELLNLFQRNPSLARTLGPKGLMPSAKRGTVATDIAQAVKEARGGLDWKGDSKGVVRAGVSSLLLAPSTQLTDSASRSHRPSSSLAPPPRAELISPLTQLHFNPSSLEDNVHTLLASVSDIALGGTGVVNGTPARVKRRKFPHLPQSRRAAG